MINFTFEQEMKIYDAIIILGFIGMILLTVLEMAGLINHA